MSRDPIKERRIGDLWELPWGWLLVTRVGEGWPCRWMTLDLVRGLRERHGDGSTVYSHQYGYLRDRNGLLDGVRFVHGGVQPTADAFKVAVNSERRRNRVRWLGKRRATRWLVNWVYPSSGPEVMRQALALIILMVVGVLSTVFALGHITVSCAT